jgi:hypothetical protein
MDMLAAFELLTTTLRKHVAAALLKFPWSKLHRTQLSSWKNKQIQWSEQHGEEKYSFIWNWHAKSLDERWCNFGCCSPVSLLHLSFAILRYTMLSFIIRIVVAVVCGLMIQVSWCTKLSLYYLSACLIWPPESLKRCIATRIGETQGTNPLNYYCDCMLMDNKGFAVCILSSSTSRFSFVMFLFLHGNVGFAWKTAAANHDVHNSF